MSNGPLSREEPIADDFVVRARVDRGAFGELYDMIYPTIFRYCLHRVGNRSLAEDVTSTVFLNVADKIADFGGETYEEFRRWVFTIATNELNANYRKTNRRKLLSVEAANNGRLRSQTSGQDVCASSDVDALQAAIAKLGERAQSIITMRFFAELSYENIAEILNISPGAARTAASRAIDAMRNDMKKQ